MKVCSFNVGRGLITKIEALEVLVNEREIYILAICEADILCDDCIPSIPGYDMFYDEDVNGKVRLVFFVWETLPVSQQRKESSMPAVLLQVGQISVTCVYHDFTVDVKRFNAHEREDCLRQVLQDHDNYAHHSALLIGDINVDFGGRTSGERVILDAWAAEQGYDQRVHEPTRISLKGLIKSETD